jgi:hypothetical protein
MQKTLILFIYMMFAFFTHGIYLNINKRIKNLSLRYIVFKKKRMGKILKDLKINVNEYAKLYYTKIIVKTAEGYYIYNELSEEEKYLIETVFALSY